MDRSLVSVIITTKNNENTLQKLLVSIKKQTYSPIEIIVVDNNSTDETKSIARKFTSKVYNKGPERSAQRNYGAKKSSGKYLVILDSDMELTKNVIKDCVDTCEREDFKAVVIPEKTVGKGFLQKVRNFERQMYMGDMSIEVARFFDKTAFWEAGGYDLNLTGPEDYDLPYRISKKHKIGRARQYLYHHEELLSLPRLLSKRYYYASRGANYAAKHPELVKTQGNLLFRRAYLRNWKKFLQSPLLGISFILVRILETIWAVAGFIKAVGLSNFLKTLVKMFK